MIKVTLKGGTVKEYPENITAMEIAKDIGMGLYKAACICRINDDFCDLRTELKEDCSLEFYSFEEAEEAKRCFRHSASHILVEYRAFPGDYLRSCNTDVHSPQSHSEEGSGAGHPASDTDSGAGHLASDTDSGAGHLASAWALMRCWHKDYDRLP